MSFNVFELLFYDFSLTQKRTMTSHSLKALKTLFVVGDFRVLDLDLTRSLTVFVVAGFLRDAGQ